ncbi:MAG: CPBP family intramembrane metalloprotease [Anaerolineales bacterium]|nr:CPBP family intramembrane metalloprotease [Anaerolineales bacterium]
MPDIFAIIFIITLVFSANLVTRLEPRYRQIFYWLLRLVNVPLFLFGLFFVMAPPDQIALFATQNGAPLTNPMAYGIILEMLAIWGILITLRSFRLSLSKPMPLDPDSPVHALALFLVGFLVGNVFMIMSQGGVETLVETAASTSILDIVWPQLLFVLLAALGVGWRVRRNWHEILARLGLARPTTNHLWLALRWIVILVLLQWTVGVIWAAIDPAQAEALGGINELLYADFNTIGEWLILALAAGIGEEILFRGALQPVFGLPVTAVLFALGHVQYGFTPITVLILIIGLVLGLIRRRTNTTTAMIVHTGYNFVLGLLALLASFLVQ